MGFVGWCAGRNPPSVHRQHSAIRATRASCSSSWAPICPYTLQDSRFTVSHPASFNNLACIIVNCRMDVSFLFCCQSSRLASFWMLQFCVVGGVSSSFEGSELSASSPTQKKNLEGAFLNLALRLSFPSKS